MARLRGDVVDQTIEKIAAMTPDDRMRFEERLKGFMRAFGKKSDVPSPARVRKVKAPAEVTGA